MRSPRNFGVKSKKPLASAIGEWNDGGRGVGLQTSSVICFFPGFVFFTGIASAVKTHVMTVRVCEGESVQKAARELRNEFSRYGGTLYLLNKRAWRLTEPSEARRNKLWKKRVAACRAAMLKRIELGMEPTLKR